MENENETETENASPRGELLKKDFGSLLTDKKLFDKFSDISLRCSDNVSVRACRNILVARCDVFNDLILSQNKRDLEFPEIKSTAMEIVREFLYTGRVNLSNEHLVEVYYAAIHFKLIKLQKSIIRTTETSLDDEDDNFGKKLLSNFVEKFSLQEENEMSNLLVDWIARIQLFPANDDLSLKGLQYLLTKTSQPEKPFLTYELDLLEYTIIKAKQAVLGEMNVMEPYSMDYEQGAIENIKNHLKELLPLIDLRKIQKDIIIDRIEPLGLFSEKMILGAYRFMLRNAEMQYIRGVLLFKWKTPNDTARTLVKISNGRKTVEAHSTINSGKTIAIIGNFSIKEFGIYKWDIVIDKLGETIYIGICNNERFDKHNNGWVLGSDGYFYYEKRTDWCGYNYVLKTGDVVNVTVNMNTKECSFSVNNSGMYRHSIPSSVYHPCVLIAKDCKLSIRQRR